MTTTTIAFVRSLVSWQDAMVAAVCYPTPCALFTVVDLEAAAVDHSIAVEWVAFLEKVAKASEELIAENEKSGAEDPHGWITNQKTLLDSVRRAHRHALEHVASFTESSGKTATS